MTFMAAIKSGLPITRKDKSWGYTYHSRFWGSSEWTRTAPGTFMDPNFFLETIRLTKEDILAKDWEVQIEFEMED